MNYNLPKLYDADSDLSKRWFVFYNFKNPDSSKMERFRIFISTKIKTKTARYKKANEIIDLYTNKLISGWNPYKQTTRRQILLLEAIELVYDFKSNSLRKRSADSYRSMINIFKEFIYARDYKKCSVAEFDFYKAQAFLDWALNNRDINPRTYNNYLMYMNSIFNNLVYRQYITVNPFKGMDKLPIAQAPIIAYTTDELQLIKTELPKFDKNLYLAAMLVFYCFMRPQEIVRLKLWQLNTVRNEINLTGNMTKNKKQNTVAIPVPLQEILKDYEFKGNPSQYIFSRKLTIGNILIAPTRLAERWREFCNKYNLPEWKGMYDLKHTGAGMCVDAGINVRDLQIHLRHSSLEQTQVYLEKFRNITSAKLINNFPRI